jgi:hypothetical protein
VEAGTSWSIRCIDEDFQPHGDVSHAREQQRYEFACGSHIYTVAS